MVEDYKSIHTGPDIDAAISRAKAGGEIDAKIDEVNARVENLPTSIGIGRNLLDNAYFGNPVDQRGGYVLLPETRVYSDEGLTNLLTTTNKFTAVVGTPTITEGYTKYINVNGVARYTEVGQAPVRGYTGTGYGIDRWRLWSAYTSVALTNGALTISASGGTAYLVEKLENSEQFYGETVTISALDVNGNLATITGVVEKNAVDYNVVMFSTDLADGSIVCYKYPDGSISFAFRVNDGKSMSVKAAKLELGTEQTLAHQDENGNWVLNEIPKYKQVLEDCQRYLVPLSKTGWGCWRMVAYNANFLLFSIPVPVEMRAKPVISGDTSKIHIREVLAGNTYIEGFTFTVDGYGPGYVNILATKTGHGLTDGQLVIESAGAGTVFANSEI